MVRAILLISAAALFVGAASQAATPNKTTLTGSVGPGFTISLTKGGTKVRTLKPGAYVIKVSDKSSSHNFHLRGPGVNKATSVSFTGSRTFRVTLKRGTYRYVCDPHNDQMRGSFTVR
jgi:plastocyanin